MTAPDFASLGLSPRLVAALDGMAITVPTPIQVQAIPPVMAGRDLLGLAQTGTGKTAAFALPLLHRILDLDHPPGPRYIRALILVPTRELAMQVREHLERFTLGTPTSVRLAIGGVSIDRQMDGLARGADVLVATPGRMIDLIDRRAVLLDRCHYLVLDEADHMLSLGFLPALRRIAQHIPLKRQTLMFSATMPPAMDEVAADYLRDPVRIEVSPPGQVATGVVEGVYFVGNGDKAKLLAQLIRAHPGDQALVFCRTKDRAEKLGNLLAHWDFQVASIHGDRSAFDRTTTIKAFRAGEIAVLVATDLAARGLDIPSVRQVYNHDLPGEPVTYVHRVGRTARAGAGGQAVTLCSPAEMNALARIEGHLGRSLPVLGGARWTQENAARMPRSQLAKPPQALAKPKHAARRARALGPEGGTTAPRRKPPA